MSGTLAELQRLTERIGLTAGDVNVISHDDIGERIPEVWASLIESEADRIRIIRNLSRVFTDLVNHPGDTLKLPQRTLIDYTKYFPLTYTDTDVILTNVELDYKTIPVTPVEVGLAGKITKQAIDEAMVSLINDALIEMARSVAQKEDLDGIVELTRPIAGSGTTNAVTFIEAHAAGNPYVSGAWNGDKAGTMPMVNAGTAVWSGTWSLAQANITADDIINLGVISQAQDVIMVNNGFVGDTLILHPKQMADLKVSPQFIQAMMAGDNRVFKTGEVGNFFGLSVYVSRNMPRLSCTANGSVPGYQAALIDSSAALALVIKRLITVETDYRPAERCHYIFITTMYKFQRVNAGAVVLINTA